MALAVDTESQVITAVAILPGNAPDSERALELAEESEANAQVEVEQTIGDCAYRRCGEAAGDGLTRQEFVDAGRKLVARVPKRPNQAHFPKEDFTIDLEAMTCQCPAGQVTKRLVRRGRRKDRRGQVTDRYAFQFDEAICGSCPLRISCVKGKSGKGRSVALHPQEARAFQRSEAIAHLGSTAVPGLGAKPILDIMVAVSDLADAPGCIEPLKSIGYEYVPEYEASMPERRYFRKGPPEAHRDAPHTRRCSRAPSRHLTNRCQLAYS